MKRSIVAFTAAVLMLGQSLCYESGIDQDKAQHFGAGGATSEGYIWLIRKNF